MKTGSEINKKKSIKKIIKAGVSFVVVAGITTGVVFGINRKDDSESVKTVQKEDTVERGNLATGVKESGSIEIGSVSQSYSLATGSSSGTTTSAVSSASSDKKSTDTSANAGGAMMMSAMGGENGAEAAVQSSSSSSSSKSSNSTSSDEELVVSKVYVTTGKTVKKGDALLKLTKSSIEKVRNIYEEEVNSAKLALKEAKVERNSSKLTAEYEYKTRIAQGESAKTTYEATIAALKQTVKKAQAAYDEAVNGIKTLPAKIKALEKSSASSSDISSTATSSQSVAGGIGEAAGKGVADGNSSVSASITTAAGSSNGSSTQTVSQLKQQLSEYKSNLSNLKSQLKAAKKALSNGKITAKETYDSAMLEYNNAKTLYDVAVDGLNDDVNSAKEDLTEAKDNLKEFNNYVKGGVIKAEYSGTITSVGYEKGDTLTSGTDIAQYMDADNVTMTVYVVQQDISGISLGDKVNVSLSAYEDTAYTGSVTSISTTSTGGNTVSYPVVVTLSGDVSSIYAGMSGSVTFVEEEVKDVTYISQKAVITDGDKSYVLKKDDSGNVTKTEITTGFSDGRNIEIKSGISEGDTIVIESQVRE